MSRSFLRAACVALALVPALAGAAPACLPTVEGAWIRTPPPGAAMLAGYAVVRNDCSAPITLVGAESTQFHMVSIHRTVEEGGMSRMRPAGDITVAAGASTEFAPGGAHLMLMHPAQAIADGETVAIDLLLADGRRITARFVVRREAPRD